MANGAIIGGVECGLCGRRFFSVQEVVAHTIEAHREVFGTGKGVLTTPPSMGQPTTNDGGNSNDKQND